MSQKLFAEEFFGLRLKLSGQLNPATLVREQPRKVNPSTISTHLIQSAEAYNLLLLTDKYESSSVRNQFFEHFQYARKIFNRYCDDEHKITDEKVGEFIEQVYLASINSNLSPIGGRLEPRKNLLVWYEARLHVLRKLLKGDRSMGNLGAELALCLGEAMDVAYRKTIERDRNTVIDQLASLFKKLGNNRTYIEEFVETTKHRQPQLANYDLDVAFHDYCKCFNSDAFDRFWTNFEAAAEGGSPSPPQVEIADSRTSESPEVDSEPETDSLDRLTLEELKHETESLDRLKLEMLKNEKNSNDLIKFYCGLPPDYYPSVWKRPRLVFPGLAENDHKYKLRVNSRGFSQNPRFAAYTRMESAHSPHVQLAKTRAALQQSFVQSIKHVNFSGKAGLNKKPADFPNDAWYLTGNGKKYTLMDIEELYEKFLDDLDNFMDLSSKDGFASSRAIHQHLTRAEWTARWLNTGDAQGLSSMEQLRVRAFFIVSIFTGTNGPLRPRSRLSQFSEMKRLAGKLDAESIENFTPTFISIESLEVISKFNEILRTLREAESGIEPTKDEAIKVIENMIEARRLLRHGLIGLMDVWKRHNYKEKVLTSEDEDLVTEEGLKILLAINNFFDINARVCKASLLISKCSEKQEKDMEEAQPDRACQKLQEIFGPDADNAPAADHE